jgi:hypothetical protein
MKHNTIQSTGPTSQIVDLCTTTVNTVLNTANRVVDTTIRIAWMSYSHSWFMILVAWICHRRGLEKTDSLGFVGKAGILSSSCINDGETSTIRSLGWGFMKSMNFEWMCVNVEECWCCYTKGVSVHNDSPTFINTRQDNKSKIFTACTRWLHLWQTVLNWWSIWHTNVCVWCYGIIVEICSHRREM